MVSYLFQESVPISRKFKTTAGKRMAMACLFCEFISGKRKFHTNGFPFMPIVDTKNTLTFLSIDFPANDDGHILVIPKKHYTYVEDIPEKIQHELIEQVGKAAKVLRKTNDGCNILLNNGRAAGQVVHHVHFHLVPRHKRDHVKIELWRRRKMTEKEFVKLHDFLSNRFKKI